tara:strand:- start:80 stop:391 length:312 start_codon:yes stop_codon:yes gene_type:complete
MKKTILDAIISLQPSYANEAIIVYGNDGDVEAAEITWGEATPISNADIQTELDRIQALEDNCYAPRRNAYPSITDQLDDIYHNGIDGWKATIKAIKDANPKAE